MNDLVSRWVYLVLLAATVSVVCGILVPTFPWSGLLWASLVVSVALAIVSRTSTRSMAEVIWDVHAEPSRALATVSVVARPLATYPANR